MPERQLLLRNGKPVRVGGRALDILTALVERPGELVSKRDLMSRAWPDIVVEEGNLKVNIASLRRQLEGPGEERFIATIIGRGYRFVSPVQSTEASLPAVHDAVAVTRDHNLPLAATRVVGRSEIIADIAAELEDHRLVTVVGPGGIGKTTVACAVAEQVLPRFEHGVWLVDLSPLKEAGRVSAAIAAAVGMTAHSANMEAALLEYLRGREMLLMLDSCEHLIDAVAANVGRILASAPGVRVLSTSREPLGLGRERVRRLPGLDAPDADAMLTARDAMTYPAVELFVERAMDRLETFRLTDADAPVVADICRRLDGLALAIELAATRVDAFGLAELRELLGDRFRVLTSRRYGPDRHQTLTATIDWSYDLLSPGEHALLRRLSVFAGPFTLASAVAVAADATITPGQIAQDMANLVAKSLVAAEASDFEVEYRLFDTTRSYAQERLAECGELARLRRRHAEHVATLVAQANLELVQLGERAWIASHRRKIDDLRVALAWAFGADGDAALAITLTVAAIPFWERLSLLDECRHAAEQALAARFDESRSERDELILCLAHGAALLYTCGPLPQAKAMFSRALDLAEKLGDLDLRVESLRKLSEHHLWTGDARSSLAVTELLRATAAFREDAAGMVNADAHAGIALYYLGDLASARERLESFLQSAPATQQGVAGGAARFEFDLRLEARGALAMVLWLSGFVEQAKVEARRQREEAEACNYALPLCASIVLVSLPIQVFTGEFAAAERDLDFVEAYAATHGLPLWRAMAACMRVKWRLDSGQPVDLQDYRADLAKIRDGELGTRYPPFLANYGEVLLNGGDPEGALSCVDRAISLYSGSGQLWGIPEMLRMKGGYIRRSGVRGIEDAAARCYREAIDIARHQGALTWELRAATDFVELERGRGGSSEAEAALATAYARFTEGFDTLDLRRARALLG